MNYLGIDYGEKRVGLSYGDDVAVAVPLPAAIGPTDAERWQQIAKTIEQRRIHEIVIGYPYNMDGTVGFKAKEVDAFVVELEKRFKLPVHRVDERLTSHQVESDLSAMQGSKRKRRTPQAQRKARQTGDIDSRSATLILQDYLNSRINTALPDIEPEFDE